MLLARMVSTCEDELICDLAETYNIYDYRNLPPYKVAIFVCGLDEDSRTKMLLSNRKVTTDRLIMASISDHLAFIAWSKTKDAQKNKNRPKKLLSVLLGESENEDNVQAFDTAEDFYNAWNEIVGGE